ncbi:uncharacterized protein LOC124165285 [Ischnura elegans]|uniref:uncharacterized protein LOC124165285 n=1 Tax=Ischnura elegans TaxID=197161 RepID=UPI001ED86B88|nr:uncharacterized protein LOC124165285 [Ischnura elegans]XP_046398583.1 uncharacterized protein LOC124165285 [Ischnura elegans]
MCSSNINTSVNIFNIPTEVLTKILLQCDVIDILSFCCTSKHLNHAIDNTYFWKQKWKTIVSTTKFTLPAVLDCVASQFKTACIRYHVVVGGEEGDEYAFPSCRCCKSYSCIHGCVEHWKPKLVVDLGSKITRIFNASTIEVRNHLSVYRIQDKFFQKSKDEKHSPKGQSIGASGDQACECVGGMSLGRHVHGYSAIEFRDLDCVHVREEKSLLAAKRSYCAVCSSIHAQYSPCANEESRMPNFNCEWFKNELCSTLQEGTGSASHLFSPGLGMRNPVGFPYLVTSYLREVLIGKFINSIINPFVLRAPGSTVFMCIPNSGSPPNVCRSILNFFFVEMKVGRVCLIPKALGLAKSESASCCITVDSGAFSTSVAVVVDERVVAVKDIPVGGWHLSKELHSSLVTRGCISPEGSGMGCVHHRSLGSKSSRWSFEGPPQVPVVSFDEASVKSMCRLAPNLHSKKTLMIPSQTQTVYLNRACSHNDCSKDLVQVCLRNEFTTGPEIHFAALSLPQVICDLTKGLPYSLKRQCLSNILLSGGNSSLNGLVSRLSCELRAILPNFHENINVILPFGPSELHTVMGASLMEFNYNRPLLYEDNEEFQAYCSHHRQNNIDQPFWLSKEDAAGSESRQHLRAHRSGEPYWLTREEFISCGPGF